MCSKLEFYLELFSQSMHWKHTCNLLKATGIITANETSSYRSTISISSRWWRFCLLVVQEQSGNSVVDFFSPSHLPFKRMFTFSDLSNPPSSGCLLSEILLITAFRAQFILQYVINYSPFNVCYMCGCSQHPIIVTLKDLKSVYGKVLLVDEGI